jgi:glycerophosphoryl diester phosphodiesterase
MNKSQKHIRPRSRIFAVIAAAVLGIVSVTCLYIAVSGNDALRFLFRQKPLIIAHRGASDTAPENTAAAFEAAINAGADGIELDVQQTADGVLIVFHDLNMERITGLDKNVSDVTYEEIQSLDAGSWFAPEFSGAEILTFEEALILLDGRCFLNIELKNLSPKQNGEKQAADLILKYDMEDKCCVTSFSYDTLKRIKECSEDIHTGLIMSRASGYFYDLEAADAFSIKSMFIKEQTVINAHRCGKEVYAWTVNTSAEMERLAAIGADHIITDKPELAKEILH